VSRSARRERGKDEPTPETAVSRKGTMGGETVISMRAKRSRRSLRQRCSSSRGGESLVSLAKESREEKRKKQPTNLQVQLSRRQDNMFSRRLNERLNARVGLMQPPQPLDEFRHLRRVLRFEGDTNDGRGLIDGSRSARKKERGE
jgi:hypothetical protein